MAATKGKVTKKKKVTKNLDKGSAYINASFNNTIITITDNAIPYNLCDIWSVAFVGCYYDRSGRFIHNRHRQLCRLGRCSE